MHKAHGVFVAAMLFAAPLAAPVAAQQGMTETRYGGLALKGGLSYGNVSNRGVFPGEAKTRSGAALGLALVTGGVVGFGVEGLYAQRGITSNTSGNSRELDYIDVPAYLRIAIANPAVEPFVYAGPQVSFEMKCGSNGGSCPSGREKVTYAAVAGGGVRLVALHGISVEGRYIYGLNDLKLSTVSDSESYKTRSFMILFGLGF